MDTEKPNYITENAEIYYRIPVFSVIFYFLQITTVFNYQHTFNADANNFFSLFALFIVLELVLFNQAFIYYIVVILKTIVLS
jgi:hypothetical protein